MADMLEALKTAVESVSKDWKVAKRSADRQDRVQRRALERMRGAYRSLPTIKEAAYEWMEAGYLKASANATLPANARQIMYAVRPYVLEVTGECWKDSSYFTQHLLPDYIEAYGMDHWNVVFDARGHLREPHGGTRVDLGTLEVRRYIRTWVQPGGADLDPSSLLKTRFPTSGPANRYRFALFIEKEGFNPLLEAARIAERFDLAIMSTKGMSVTAARLLVEKLSDRSVTILVAHDFDKAGFSIAHTLASSGRRYTFGRAPNVVDLGLRLSDVAAMELQSEPVQYKGHQDPRHNLRQSGATQEECDYLVRNQYYGSWDGERVELNAMAADQFVAWLEAKLVEAGVQKLVPSAHVLEHSPGFLPWRPASGAGSELLSFRCGAHSRILRGDPRGGHRRLARAPGVFRGCGPPARAHHPQRGAAAGGRLPDPREHLRRPAAQEHGPRDPQAGRCGEPDGAPRWANHRAVLRGGPHAGTGASAAPSGR